MDQLDGKYQNLKKHVTHFDLVLTISEVLPFKIFAFEKVGQGHDSQSTTTAMAPFDGKYQNI